MMSADAIATALKAADGNGLPPVDQWSPPYCGEIDMRIARDGTWFHEGTPIGRIKLVRLFSTILKREGEAYFLITPVEKVKIQVEDVPFIAVDFEADEKGLSFTTALGDRARAGKDHPLRFEHISDETRPYIDIRKGLEARIDRKSAFRLMELAVEHNGQIGVWSDGAFFPIMDA